MILMVNFRLNLIGSSSKTSSLNKTGNLSNIGNLSKAFNRLKISQLLLLIFSSSFILSLPITFWQVKNAKKAQIMVGEPKQQPPKPNYKEGEVLVKFKPNFQGFNITKPGLNLNKDIININDLDQNQPEVQLLKRQNIETIEKVFKGTQEPQVELNKFKNHLPQRKINEKEFLKIDFTRIFKITFDPKTTVNDQIQALKGNQELDYVEPNFYYYTDSSPNDPYYLDSYPDNTQYRDPNWNPPHDYQWNIKVTNSDNNWETDTSQIIAAVIDTGLDVNHPDLGNVWLNVDEIPGDGIDNDGNGCIDDINGSNTRDYICSGNIADDNNHGTHVSGVISAKTNNAIGLAGITNNTPIMAVKAMDANGFGFTDDVVEGIYYAANNGARVINMSLGGSYSTTFRDALDYAITLGVIPVASAGNGNEYSPGKFPASYKPGITVGGIDENKNKLLYANYGPNIDIVAPAGGSPCLYRSKPSFCSNILSLKSSENSEDPELIVGGQYLRLSGTSMAAPHVAGVIAFLLAQHPEFTMQNVENYLRFNSIDPNGLGHNEKLGWGIINSTGSTFIESSNIDFEIDYPAENSLVGRQFNVAGTINADNFDHFIVEYRLEASPQWSTEGIALVNGGTVPIIPVLPLTLSKVATIILPQNSALGVYEIKTTLFMNDGNKIFSTKKVNFLQKPGTNWLFTGESDVYDGEILVADINNDNLKEVILYNFGDYQQEKLKVYDSNYNLKWEKSGKGEVVVGDIDKRTPTKEVVMGTSSKIYVYDNNGQPISDMTLSYNGLGNILISDLDNNGREELCFGGIKCYEQNANNQFVQKLNYVADGPIAAGDLNGDGKKELVVYNTGNKIQAINYQGSLLGSYTIAGSYEPDGMILVDIDKDGKEEIATHIQWGDTKLLKLSGSSIIQVWSYNNSNNYQTLAAADFNYDTYPEIYIQVSPSLNETILDRNGNAIFSGTSMLYWGNSHNGGVALGDKDNNSKIEITHVGWYSGDKRQYQNIREYDFNNLTMNFIEGDWRSILPQWTDLSNGYAPSFDTNHSAALTDLDNNGKLDLVIQGVGIIEYETSGISYWPHRYHDYQRTGSYNFEAPIIPSPSPSPSVSPSPTPPPIGCYQTCVKGDKCTDGLVCGEKWCVTGVAPANPNISKCYNPNCSCSFDCNCH